MSTFKKIGLMTSGEAVHHSATISEVLSHYPQAEIVSDKAEILSDENIHLVFVSAKGEEQLSLVGEAIRSGKHVRVI